MEVSKPCAENCGRASETNTREKKRRGPGRRLFLLPPVPWSMEVPPPTLPWLVSLSLSRTLSDWWRRPIRNFKFAIPIHGQLATNGCGQSRSRLPTHKGIQNHHPFIWRPKELFYLRGHNPHLANCPPNGSMPRPRYSPSTPKNPVSNTEVRS